MEDAQNKESSRPSGPKPETVQSDKDWEDLASDLLGAGKPPEGWEPDDEDEDPEGEGHAEQKK
ncbi:MAG: hypothetical protein ACF8SC_06715 [Phycisphaerales bacterium JB037]